jgi:type VI secretion system secreted protein VgrG
MSINTHITIQIAGEELTRFSKLVINQKVNTHHRFSLLQPLPKEFLGQGIDKTQQYIGKSIKITIDPSNMSTDSSLVFTGIITEAQMVRTAGAAGGIIINGFSPSIAMEGAPNVKSFTDKSLTDIIQEITGKYSQKEVKPSISIQNDASMPYTVQYGESDFGFLSRMAQKKGLWYYYNGEEMFFGKPKSKTFSLEYGRSLHSFNIEMRAKSLGFEYIGYDPSSSETQKASSSEVGYQPQGYSKSVFESSNKLFPDTSRMLYSHALEEGNSRTHLVSRATTQLQSRAADLVTAKGESDETGLRIGDIVSIHESAFASTGNPLDGIQEQQFGSYIITDIMHVCDETGSYHNTFDAVPDSVLSPPYGNVHSFPSADTQPAVVTDNNDPAGLGRVQVAFAWQKDDGVSTPWLRMTNPHAGGGKGMYFIPEIGEEVLVAFENGNAEKPFVLGAMYNGNESSSYHTSGNDKKVVETRSGTRIVMDDAQGSVFIEDPSGNTWLMDGKGNISVNAPKNFTVAAGESINMTAGKNVSVSAGDDITNSANKNIAHIAGQDINITAAGDMKENANNKNELIEKKYVRASQESTQYAEKVTVFSSKENMLLESTKKTVEINSAEKSNIF